MTLFEKVYNKLEPLNIPIVRGFYKGNAKSYCIVSVYTETDFNVFDNENEAELYKFKITHWHEPNEEDQANTIKKLMKEAGFRFIYSADLYDDGYFGKALDFQGVLTLEELTKGEN